MRTTVRTSAISFATFILAAGALAPLSAHAQPIPSYAQGPAQQQTRQGQETITGTVSLVQGEYVEINDDRGYVDRVDFTTDTVFRPGRVTLRPGMHVRITGYNQGQIFDAYEIAVGGGAPSYGGGSPSYGYNPQPAAPVPQAAPLPEEAPVPQPDVAQAPEQPLPPYATPVYPQQQPVYSQPVYSQPAYAQPVYVPYAVPYPVYAYPAPPPYAYYPRFRRGGYVRFGVGFRIR